MFGKGSVAASTSSWLMSTVRSWRSVTPGPSKPGQAQLDRVRHGHAGRPTVRLVVVAVVVVQQAAVESVAMVPGGMTKR